MSMQSEELPDTAHSKLPFQQEWHLNSPARIFSNPQPAKQRAWERQPRLCRQLADAAATANKKLRTIWKRYPMPTSSSQSDPSPVAKAVKKVKLTMPSHSTGEAVCKRDRRASSLPHKSFDHLPDPSSTAQINQPHPVHGTNSTAPATNPVTLTRACVQQQQSDAPQPTTLSSDLAEQAQLPDMYQRVLRSSTSLLKRRRTDLVFSHTQPVSSPSRKRRFSDVSALPNKPLEFETAQNTPTQQTFSTSTDGIDLPTKLESGPEIPPSPESIPPFIQTGHETHVDQENFKLEPEAMLETETSSPSAVPMAQTGLVANNSNEPVASAEPVLAQLEPSLASDVGMLNTINNPSHQESDLVHTVTTDISGLDQSTIDHQESSHKSEQNIADGHPPPSQTTSLLAAWPSEEGKSTVMVPLHDDDTDVLHDFLNRAQASKAAKIAEQSSVLNRRDSDRVKDALASPRKPLEVLDTNSSPRRRGAPTPVDESSPVPRLNCDDHKSDGALDKPTEVAGLADNVIAEQIVESVESHHPARRSKRSVTRRPLIPPRSSSASGLPPNTISVRLQDQSEMIVLKKSEAKELEALTRANTRLNRGEFSAQETVMKLNKEEVISSMDSSSPGGVTKVTWNENLVSYFLEAKDLQSQLPSQSEENDKVTEMGNSRPRARRAKMLGAMNGTPAKQRIKRLEPTAISLDDEFAPGTIPQASNIGVCDYDNNNTARLSEQLHSNELLSLKAHREDREADPQRSPQKSSDIAPRRIPTPAKLRNREIQLQSTRCNSAGHGVGPVHSFSQLAAMKEDKENKELDPATVKEKSAPLHLPTARTATTAAVKLNAMDEKPRRTVAPRKASVAVENAPSKSASIPARRR